MKLRVLALAVAVTAPAAAQQQPDWAAVEIKAEKVAEGLYMLTGRGGNIGLSVGKDGAFVIDDQYAPLTDKILAAIKAITPDPATKADLQAYRDMVKTIRDRIAKLKAEGKTRDEVLAAKPTADFDAKWGPGFINGERMTGLVYDSLP